MTVSKRSAALKTYTLWAWLEQNPFKSKEDYPLYDELYYEYQNNSCYWCTLFYRHGDNYVCISKNCPLAKANKSCDGNNSLYNNWFYNKSPKVNAGEIAQIAWQEYKRLGG